MRILLVAIATATLTGSGVSGQTPDPLVGTWTLNVAKSTYNPGPPPYKRATYRVERHGDGLKMTYDMVHPRGGTTHLEWTGKFDGTAYTVQGIEEFVTYAYRPVGDGSYEVIVRMDERIAATSRLTVSSDGKTMTTTSVGKDSRGQTVRTSAVYEKEASTD